MPINTCVFDAYGTLFDVNAAARQEAKNDPRLTEVWPQLARDWRSKQLEYTWLRATAGRHTDFWQVTQDGLDWAMEAAALDDANLRERLLALYWELPAYPEVPEMLAALKSQGRNTAILSNGSPDMLNGAIQSAGITGTLDAALSVEDVGVFKPHDTVYDLVQKRFPGDRADVLFVSSNGWDACAAAGYGFTTVWVNRMGLPMDRLYAQPHHVIKDLTTIPEFT